MIQAMLNELKRIGNAFTQVETWVGIAIIILITSLGFGVTLYAMKFDFISQIYGLATSCIGLSNNVILTMIFMTTGFFISSVLFLGEYVNYIESKRINAHTQARIALRNCLYSGVTTVAIGLSTIYILIMRC